MLDPHVTSYNIPSQLRACYLVSGHGDWTLDIRRCPPEARSYFPRLQLTANAKEYEEMPEWQRLLYAWDADKSKYQLTEQTAAWHVDEEEVE